MEEGGHSDSLRLGFFGAWGFRLTGYGLGFGVLDSLGASTVQGMRVGLGGFRFGGSGV